MAYKMKRGSRPAFKSLGETPYKAEEYHESEPTEVVEPDPVETPEPVEVETNEPTEDFNMMDNPPPEDNQDQNVPDPPPEEDRVENEDNTEEVVEEKEEEEYDDPELQKLADDASAFEEEALKAEQEEQQEEALTPEQQAAINAHNEKFATWPPKFENQAEAKAHGFYIDGNGNVWPESASGKIKYDPTSLIPTAAAAKALKGGLKLLGKGGQWMARTFKPAKTIAKVKSKIDKFKDKPGKYPPGYDPFPQNTNVSAQYEDDQ